jgi:hypothetical protein
MKQGGHFHGYDENAPGELANLSPVQLSHTEKYVWRIRTRQEPGTHEKKPISGRNYFKKRKFCANKMAEIRMHKKILESKPEGRKELIIL